MAEYRLYGFGESGNSYKAALMLALTGRDWECLPVDFFSGVTRGPAYRTEINQMGEVPVLLHGDLVLSQSGVILDYLAEKTGRFGPESEGERREILRWILFDNHKFTSYFATLRFMIGLQGAPESPVTDFLRARAVSAFQIVEKHLAGQDFLVASRPTIADISLAGYVYYDERTGIDRADFPAIEAWKSRIASLPGWRDPYELLPRAKKD
jgi:glutathione S-transferase